MDYKLLMDTAMLAGEVMLASGAETYRVEDTMHHILKTSELSTIETIVLLTGITASISGEAVKPVTMVKRVSKRSTDLSKIEQVNQISRKYCGNEITLSEANLCLKKIQSEHYPKWLSFMAPIGVGVGFTVFFGGQQWDSIASVFVGLCLSLVMSACKKLKLNTFIADVVMAFSVASVSMLLLQLLGDAMHLEAVVIGSIMPLVPGVAVTTAVRDTLQGDYISGSARTLEAFLKATGIAVGIGLGIFLGGGGIG